MAESADFAELKWRDFWTRHPVLGDPSFDNFEQVPGNPIYRGAPPLEWPVNGFLFRDPGGTGLFAYVGRYARDYRLSRGGLKCDCVVLHSRDEGRTWTEVGPAFRGGFSFQGDSDGANHAPDVSVVFHEDRYHLAYDWVHDGATWETVFNPSVSCDSGVGYAWSESPAGPFHRWPEPVLRNFRHLSPVEGKYRRLYAPTLLRRERDWLLLCLTDSASLHAWGLFALTANSPTGPWNAPRLVLSLESDGFHPALMEFFPAFVHQGDVWAPATSVALNRNFQCLWRASLEKAHDPAAWRMVRHGSMWHAEMSGTEAAGIWGQTISGIITENGRWLVLYPSRDEQNCGTINLAEGSWDLPWRERGFVLSGCGGPSLTLLRRSYGAYSLHAKLRLSGTARLLWGWHGLLGPDRSAADATLHDGARRKCFAWEWRETGWRLLCIGADTQETLASGNWVTFPETLGVEMGGGGELGLFGGDAKVWSGSVVGECGQIGLLVEAHTRLEVLEFVVAGESEQAATRWHWREAFLGTGVDANLWEPKVDSTSPCGEVAFCRAAGGRLKWNFVGTGIRWWAPRSPQAGRVRLKIDGFTRDEIDLRAASLQPASPVFTCVGLQDGGHALVIEALEGCLATGGIEVFGPELDTSFGVDNGTAAGTMRPS